MNAPTTRTGGPALAALLLLPVLALAWPWFGSVLHDDVVPQATGAGFLALALLPAAAWMVLRGLQPSVRASMGLFATILVSVAWIGTDSLTDTFEASRTLLQWFTALVCCLAGASLDASGRRVLAHGAVTLTLAFAGYALFDRDRALTGALGNTGSISEVALPGAVIGAVSFACARGPWRWIGLAAFVVFLSYVLAVPVLAGSAAYAIGEACKWPVGLSRKPNHAKAFYGTLAAAALLGIGITLTPIDPMDALYWSAVINGIIAVPVMLVMMLMTAKPAVMGSFTVRGPLRLLGWAATAAMALCVVGMGLTWVL